MELGRRRLSKSRDNTSQMLFNQDSVSRSNVKKLRWGRQRHTVFPGVCRFEAERGI